MNSLIVSQIKCVILLRAFNMYDEYARQLIDSIPDLPDIDRDECRRALSTVYFHVIRSRLKISSDDTENNDLDSARLLIRRMADALESIAVFDRLHDLNRPVEIENACAFVAAESIGLLALSYTQEENGAVDDVLITEANYAALESGLLYMIGGYDSNASAITGIIKTLELPDGGSNSVIMAHRNNAVYALSRILSLCRSDVRRPRKFSPYSLGKQNITTEYNSLLSEIRARFYERIGSSVESYLDWLGGFEDSGLDRAITGLESLRKASISSGYPGYSPFSDMYHLSNLLLITIQETKKRSLVGLISIPQVDSGSEFLQRANGYIKYRARG